jgi:hypothetical protein
VLDSILRSDETVHAHACVCATCPDQIWACMFIYDGRRIRCSPARITIRVLIERYARLGCPRHTCETDVMAGGQVQACFLQEGMG